MYRLPFLIFIVVNLAARMRWSRAVSQWLVAHDPCPPEFRLPRPRGIHERAEPVPARSGRPLFLAGVPVAPFFGYVRIRASNF